MKDKTVFLTVLVASLGYFVDVYDLQLFNIVSRESIIGLGINDPLIVSQYDYVLFLWQMAGMLAGGVLWGVLGDVKGRKNVLFASILMYSLANIANAFVLDMTQYSIVRFIAGLGLAGELGAAVTLVNEIMTKEKRGYGTMTIVMMGALGAVAAALISKFQLSCFGLENWQIMYLIGGVLGLLLLLLRMGTYESEIFDAVKKSQIKVETSLALFASMTRIRKYLACILIGLPVWYCIGILIKFSENFSVINSVAGEPVKVGFAIMYAYIGLSVGDLLSGIFSQFLQSRKRVVGLYLILSFFVAAIFLYSRGLSTQVFYGLCFTIGSVTGYWALFVTMASESFGTNIRATVTTTVPNFVRGAVVPLTLCFKGLGSVLGSSFFCCYIGLCLFRVSFTFFIFYRGIFCQGVELYRGLRVLIMLKDEIS